MLYQGQKKLNLVVRVYLLVHYPLTTTRYGTPSLKLLAVPHAFPRRLAVTGRSRERGASLGRHFTFSYFPFSYVAT